MAWIKDKLMNRKIEGESSLDSIEKVQDNLVDISEKMEVVDGTLKLSAPINLASGNEEVNIQPNAVIVKYSDKRVQVLSDSIYFSAGNGEVVDILGQYVDNAEHYLHVIGDFKVGDSLEVLNDVKAKTLKQTQPNYSFDFAQLIVPEDTTNFEIYGTPYCKLSLINGVVHLVCAFKFHNKDTQSHAFRLGQISIPNVPEEISKVIYNVDGYNAHESGHPSIIRNIIYGLTTGASSVIRLSNGSDSDQLVLYQAQAHSIAGDAVETMTFECNLIAI